MLIRPRPHTGVDEYSLCRSTFIPRLDRPIGGGSGLSSSSKSLIHSVAGLSVPIFCLGLLSTLALVGLFAAVIGASVYVNYLQKQVREICTGAGDIITVNSLVLVLALFYSIFVLMKHRRNVSSGW